FPEVQGVVNTSAPDGQGGWYIGGTFTHVGGEERLRLAHIDSSGQLTSWNPGINAGAVNALVVNNGVIYAGGVFSAAGGGTGATMRNHLAAFDAAGNLLSWNPGVSGGTGTGISALTVFNDVVYAGGWFTAAGGGTGTATRNNLAAF